MGQMTLKKQYAIYSALKGQKHFFLFYFKGYNHLRIKFPFGNMSHPNLVCIRQHDSMWGSLSPYPLSHLKTVCLCGYNSTGICHSYWTGRALMSIVFSHFIQLSNRKLVQKVWARKRCRLLGKKIHIFYLQTCIYFFMVKLAFKEGLWLGIIFCRSLCQK